MSAPPAWLFSNNNLSTTDEKLTAQTAADKTTMAKSEKKSKTKAKGSSSKPGASTPPSQLMDLVETFLTDNDFTEAHSAFTKHRAAKGWHKPKASKTAGDKPHSLVTV